MGSPLPAAHALVGGLLSSLSPPCPTPLQLGHCLGKHSLCQLEALSSAERQSSAHHAESRQRWLGLAPTREECGAGWKLHALALPLDTKKYHRQCDHKERMALRNCCQEHFPPWRINHKEQMVWPQCHPRHFAQSWLIRHKMHPDFVHSWGLWQTDTKLQAQICVSVLLTLPRRNALR